MVERLAEDQRAGGSIPSLSTNMIRGSLIGKALGLEPSRCGFESLTRYQRSVAQLEERRSSKSEDASSSLAGSANNGGLV